MTTYSKHIKDFDIQYTDSTKGDFPIFIFHGWNQSKEKFLPLGEELSALGYRTIIVDLPGFGKSTGFTESVGSLEYGEIMKSFILSFTFEHYALFGFSFGGKVVLCAASSLPKDIPLLLCSSAGLRRELKMRQKIMLQTTASLRLILGSHYDKVKGKFVKTGAKAAGNYDYLHTPPALKKIMSRVVNEDFSQEISKLKNPSLLLWGLLDNSTPILDGLQFHELLSNSFLKIFFDANHALPMNYPKELAYYINLFLKHE